MPMLICSPKTLPKDVETAAKAWEEREKSKLFVHVGSRNFNRSTVDWVWEQRATIVQAKIIDVVLDTSGGSPDAAYQLVNTLRSISPRLRVFVPDWAKSAATLFCLGADEVYMGQSAELGPLDMQIADPRNPDDSISALEQFQAIDYIRTIAFLTLDEFRKLMVAQTKMRLPDILSEAWQFGAELISPLYLQVDPLLLGTAYRALAVSVQYGQRLMSRYAYNTWTKSQINELLDKLTWKYPSHSFVIDYKEAVELGLKVSLLKGKCEEESETIVNKMKQCIGFIGLETSHPEVPKPTTKQIKPKKEGGKNG